jgi:6-phosphogluconolactonase
MIEIAAFPDRPSLMQAAAVSIAEALRHGIATRGRACAALSGGSTPEPAYQALAALDLNWRQVTFALVDERFVAPDDPASNEGMLRRALAPALANGAALAPMYSPHLPLERAAEAADAAYRDLTVDVAVMGMGADGHTASWFAGAHGLAEALDPNTARTVVAVDAPGAAGARQRLTLTLCAVQRATHTLLLITSADKRRTLQEAQARRLPVSALFDDDARAPHVLWAP